VRQHHWPSRRCRRLALRLRGAPEGRDPEDLLVGLAGARQGLHLPGRPRLGRRSDYLAELTNVPELAAESFAGVANPFSLGRLAAAERVLDLGSGAGTDSLVAAEMGTRNVECVEADAERLPFPDASFDVVISNGVIDLIPDKGAVFRELFRVLVPGGRLQRGACASWPRTAHTVT